MNIKLEEIKKEANRKRKSRKIFINKYKNKKEVLLDELFKEKHDEVFRKIDCLSCSNCCRTVGPHFTNRDIERIRKMSSEIQRNA